MQMDLLSASSFAKHPVDGAGFIRKRRPQSASQRTAAWAQFPTNFERSQCVFHAREHGSIKAKMDTNLTGIFIIIGFHMLKFVHQHLGCFVATFIFWVR